MSELFLTPPEETPEAVIDISRQLVDIHRTPAIPMPVEADIIPISFDSHCFKIASRTITLEELEGKPLMLLNSLLQMRDRPASPADLWQAGFRRDSKYHSAYCDLPKTKYKLSAAFQGKENHSSWQFVEEVHDDRLKYRLNPNLIFYDGQSGAQLSPTYESPAEPSPVQPQPADVALRGVAQIRNRALDRLSSRLDENHQPSQIGETLYDESRQINKPPRIEPPVSKLTYEEEAQLLRELARLKINDLKGDRAAVSSHLEQVLSLVFDLPIPDPRVAEIWPQARTTGRDLYDSVGLVLRIPRSDVTTIVKNALQLKLRDLKPRAAHAVTRYISRIDDDS